MRPWGLLGALLGGVLLAEVLGRAAGLGALGGNEASRNVVALTFDDGPSARTPELLAVLARHGARATFFVTQPASRQFPALLDAIRRDGHGLEAHGRWHIHALLLPPWREWAQIAWHPRVGEGRLLYRPPYGGHSPLTRLFARLLGREVALWDAEGRDWLKADAEALARQALGRLRPGSVLLLHDGPEVTPELLSLLLDGLGARGWTAVPMHELPPRRIGVREGWRRLRASYGG